MAKASQQMARMSTPINEQTQEQTHNRQQSAIVEVNEYVRRLSYV